MNEQMNNLPDRIGKAVEDAIETGMNRAFFEFESRLANIMSGATVRNPPSVDAGAGLTEYAKREFPLDILSGLTRQVSQIQQDSENTRLLAEIAVDVRSILEAIATQGGG